MLEKQLGAPGRPELERPGLERQLQVRRKPVLEMIVEGRKRPELEKQLGAPGRPGLATQLQVQKKQQSRILKQRKQPVEPVKPS